MIDEQLRLTVLDLASLSTQAITHHYNNNHYGRDRILLFLKDCMEEIHGTAR